MSFPISFSRPFLIAGLLATHSLNAMTPADLAERLARNERVLLVDVRASHAYGEGHIPGAINIPLALLQHKPLPSAPFVVVYGDGLGVVDDAQALGFARAKPGVKADVLEGGYAAWLAETRLSTALPGAGPEKLPSITYDQLVAANKGDMVLVDLRGTGAAESASKKTRAAGVSALAVETDVVADFGAKLGVPVVAASGGSAAAALAKSGESRMASARSAATTAGAHVPSDPAKLLVLVADDEASAAEIARQLRASGHYRFTVLIGGTEIIRHEGRQGLGRMDGRSTPVQQ
jgi:rhodanese-related sulfurtransferase